MSSVPIFSCRHNNQDLLQTAAVAVASWPLNVSHRWRQRVGNTHCRYAGGLYNCVSGLTRCALCSQQQRPVRLSLSSDECWPVRTRLMAMHLVSTVVSPVCRETVYNVHPLFMSIANHFGAFHVVASDCDHGPSELGVNQLQGRPLLLTFALAVVQYSGCVSLTLCVSLSQCYLWLGMIGDHVYTIHSWWLLSLGHNNCKHLSESGFIALTVIHFQASQLEYN